MKISELNLLVVEDDRFQLNTLVNMLRSLGAISISHAENGEQALEIICRVTSKPVDVAICDLNMPEMDGMEFLRHLSEENNNVAIILISALDGKLLSSVARMTKLSGLKLLGAIEKPIMLTTLNDLLLKYDKSEQKVQSYTGQTFTLEEILQGIRANEFEPFFQPKVSLKTGKLLGAEALARWIHPEHGVISPYAFISLLEESGNIDELTFIMLEKAAAACRSFQDRGHYITISINLSLTSLNDPKLAEKITQVVRKAGVEPQYIVLEITESAAMSDVAHSLENLARLCMNGFSLSIDDYGTGYSSLQQLTRIAFSELKIDQSFVKDCADNKSSLIVVESSIDMAHKLHVKSVAEGVETQQDWDILKSVGCDTVQGYFIAKPVDITAFYEFMRGYCYFPPTSLNSSAQPQNNIKLIVVDDNAFTRKTVVRVLNDLGYANIADTDSSKSALKLFKENKYDLIITDIHMPEMNGLELVKLIRCGKTHAKPDSRIIVLSSFSQMDVLGTALALDINGFLVKPAVPAVVAEKLEQAISEPLRLKPPVAYEAIKVDLRSLPNPDQQTSDSNREKINKSGKHYLRTGNKNEDVSCHTIRNLRPGMTLIEDIYLTDGSLLMSSGHCLSQLSINRLNDLRELIPSETIDVQE